MNFKKNLRELSESMPTSRYEGLPTLWSGGVLPDAINSCGYYCMTNFLSRWTDFALARGLRLAGILIERAALLVAYNPSTTGAGFAWNDLAVLVLWGIGGFIVAMRRFTWMPQGR